jgi:ketosteroid isomerase-like protein
MVIEQARPNVLEILDRVLDKGIVIDARVNVMLVGIDLVTVAVRVVVASLETYLEYANTLNDDRPGRPSTVNRRTGRSWDAKASVSLQIVRQAFDAWNGHNVERYAALLADGYFGETHGLPPPIRGREAASEAMDRYLRLLPDCHFTIEGAIAAGDDVLVSWLATGTPRDQYSGANLTARPLQIPGCTVTRLRDRKIVHTWNYWDTPAYST